MKNVFVTNMPFTEEGAKLELTEEMENNCKVVYRLDGKGGATFAELWSPDKDYSDEFIILPLRTASAGVSTVIYDVGTKFANVIGSSGDEVPGGFSCWMELLRNLIGPQSKLSVKYEVESCCAEHDKIYASPKKGELPANKTIDDFKCKGLIVGGHVLMNADTAETVLTGLDTVSLLPICNKHNTFSIGSGTGAGYYMRLARPMQAVELKGYKKVPKKMSFQAELG